MMWRRRARTGVVLDPFLTAVARKHLGRNDVFACRAAIPDPQGEMIQLRREDGARSQHWMIPEAVLLRNRLVARRGATLMVCGKSGWQMAPVA